MRMKVKKQENEKIARLVIVYEVQLVTRIRDYPSETGQGLILNKRQ